MIYIIPLLVILAIWNSYHIYKLIKEVERMQGVCYKLDKHYKSIIKTLEIEYKKDFFKD